MTFDALTYEKHDHLALITLNRPDKLNAIDETMRAEILDVLSDAGSDDGIRVVAITGAGRGFCSGADVSDPAFAARATGDNLPTASQNARLDELGWVGRQAIALYQLDKPTIAVLNGVSAGAGMGLALACDLRVGSRDSHFRTVFAERAMSPDHGTSFFLPRIVGYSRALDLILTSRDVDGEEAYRLGLLDRFVEPEGLMPAALELANEIARLPPLAVRAAKRVTQQNLGRELEDALRNEMVQVQYARRAVNDVRESLAARSERRQPRFTGT
jgi:enoyl-CoA hydratase/carnithine racemase